MSVFRARDLLAEPAPAGYPLGIHAFCKVNLGLRVGPRRADGYHDLDTVFQTLDFADTLYARPRPRGLKLRVVRRGPARRAGFATPSGPSNLVARAARLLRDRFGIREGAELLLIKRVPAGSGLGGGSSDGVAALRLLARLWGVPLSPRTGAELVRSLGSDCAFLWQGGRARARGRGERLRRLPTGRLGSAILVLPRRGIATARAYKWLDISRSSKDLTVSKRIHTIFPLRSTTVAESAAAGAENDLEEVVARHCPEVNAARQLLVEQGLGPVRMSGSGSAVFGILPRGRSLHGVAQRLRRGPFDVVVARFTRFGSLWCRSGRPARTRP